MKTILEQSFDEMYNLAKDRVLKCIQPVDQLDTFTKFMMFETLNQILLEVFGGSRYMYLIKVTDTTFVVSFLDRYKIHTTKSLIIPFASVFEIPDKETILQMDVSELKTLKDELKNNNTSLEDVSLQLGMSRYWMRNLWYHRKTGGSPKAHIDRKQIANTAHLNRMRRGVKYSNGLCVALRAKSDDLPVMCDLISKICPEKINRNHIRAAVNNYQRCSDKVRYDTLIAESDKQMIDHLYISYCQSFLDILQAYSNDDVKISKGYASAIGRMLKIHQRYDHENHITFYSNEDLAKLEDLKHKLTQIITNLEGGKND